MELAPHQKYKLAPKSTEILTAIFNSKNCG